MDQLRANGHVKRQPGRPLEGTGKVVSEGPERGLEEINAIIDRANLALARNPQERRFLDERLSACEGDELRL